MAVKEKYFFNNHTGQLQKALFQQDNGGTGSQIWRKQSKENKEDR